MNSEQLHFFRTFGYIVLRQLPNKDDLTQLARDHRDALATQYSAERNTGAEADAFTKAVGHAGSIKHFKPHRQNDYLRNWLDNPQQAPVRQRWINRFEEIDYLDQPGVGEPRQN